MRRCAPRRGGSSKRASREFAWLSVSSVAAAPENPGKRSRRWRFCSRSPRWCLKPIKLQGILPRLDAVVTSLAVYAPVVVIGTAARRPELSALIDAGAADYLMRDGGCLPAALGLIRSRLRQAQRVADSTHEPFEDAAEDFWTSAAPATQ